MEYFKLYSNCFIVKGAKRSLIFDSQKYQINFIPNDLVEIIEKTERLSIEEIQAEYGESNQKTINEYFENLIALEYGFYCYELEKNWFPKIDTTFKQPNQISNIILENINDFEFLKKVIFELEKLQVTIVEFMYYDNVCDIIEEICNLFENTLIKNINLNLLYSEKIDNEWLKKITSRYFRISKIIIHSSPFDKSLESDKFDFVNIIFTQKMISNFLNCGMVKSNHFSKEYDHFLESINHNTCLHKKLTIDKDGNIKNCPAMPQSFGNIIDTTLEEAISHPDFKKYWNVTKDMIQICKDCEFRHICTDCRAYTERTHFEKDIDLSKPLKCGYNPYTNEWADWSTNPLKQKAIEYYGMQELVKKYTCNKS